MPSKNGFAIALAWPEYIGKQTGSWYDPLMRWLGFNKNFHYQVGHAAVILVYKNSGNCYYFDCGRFHAPYQYGRIRDVSTDSDLAIQTKALFKKDKISNLEEILTEVQMNKSFLGQGALHASYTAVDFNPIQLKAKEFQDKDVVPFGPFVLNGTNCCRFVRATILAGIPASRQKFALNYLWPFKPMPITIFNILSNKIILSELNPSNKKAGYFNPITAYNKDNVRGTLPAPIKPNKIPSNSQWLGGEVAGSWFSLKQMGNEYIVTRYSAEGEKESEGIFLPTDKHQLDTNKPYRFTYLSHCKKVTIEQDNKLLALLKKEKKEVPPMTGSKHFPKEVSAQ